MWSIAKRELALFFSSAIGYMVIGLFLIGNTLLLWIFDNQFNILNAGFGDLILFFESLPWLLIFLIAALSMRSFSDEIRVGTLQILLTKPISLYQIVMGKFLGIFLLVIIALFPTMLNLVALHQLLEANTSIDWGIIITAYLGVLLVSAVFIGIGLCCSLLFKNQVAAFLAAVLINYIQFDLWDQLAQLTTVPTIYEGLMSMGIKPHYANLSRGILSLTDGIYFLGISSFLIYCALQLLNRLKQ